MERINVVSAVANLQKEMEFYRDEYRECREIIKQLSGEPPVGFKYIHPHDVAKIYHEAKTSTDIVKLLKVTNNFLTIDGQHYKQSINMPVVNKGLFK